VDCLVSPNKPYRSAAIIKSRADAHLSRCKAAYFGSL
jgi:hypothetical protein